MGTITTKRRGKSKGLSFNPTNNSFLWRALIRRATKEQRRTVLVWSKQLEKSLGGQS